MQWWYYRGQVTTPVNIPGKGPTVVRPRDKFQAPFSAVAHLKRMGRVVACKAPKEPPVPKSQPEAGKDVQVRAVAVATVVASTAEPQAKVTENENVVASVAEEKPEEKPPEDEKAKPKTKAKKSKEKAEEKEEERES